MFFGISSHRVQRMMFTSNPLQLFKCDASSSFYVQTYREYVGLFFLFLVITVAPFQATVREALWRMSSYFTVGSPYL